MDREREREGDGRKSFAVVGGSMTEWHVDCGLGWPVEMCMSNWAFDLNRLSAALAHSKGNEEGSRFKCCQKFIMVIG